MLAPGTVPVPTLWFELNHHTGEAALAGREGAAIHAIGLRPGPSLKHATGSAEIAQWGTGRALHQSLEDSTPSAACFSHRRAILFRSRPTERPGNSGTSAVLSWKPTARCSGTRNWKVRPRCPCAVPAWRGSTTVGPTKTRSAWCWALASAGRCGSSFRERGPQWPGWCRNWSDITRIAQLNLPRNGRAARTVAAKHWSSRSASSQGRGP